MGLFNKLFTKSHEPYELKGRWYKMTFTVNDDGDFVINTSDIPAIDIQDVPHVPFGYYVQPGNQKIMIFKGLVLDVKTIPVHGRFDSTGISFDSNMSNAPVPMSLIEFVNLDPGEIFDIYLYVIKQNTISLG